MKTKTFILTSQFTKNGSKVDIKQQLFESDKELTEDEARNEYAKHLAVDTTVIIFQVSDGKSTIIHKPEYDDDDAFNLLLSQNA